jgi:5-methylcytosine-specific restriction endonuclease McrA
MTLDQKCCAKCGELKDVHGFGRCKRASDGLNPWCNKCHAEDQRLRYASNPERYKRYRKRRYDADPMASARKREYNKEHPEGVKQRYHMRRAREARAGDSFTAAQWAELKEQCGNKCLCCGCAEPEIKLTPDHVVPLSKGGSGGIENIQPLCLTCNLHKHTKTIDYRPRNQPCG